MSTRVTLKSASYQFREFAVTYRWPIAAILLIMFGLSLRAWLLLTNPLWSDEMYSIWAVRQPWPTIISGAIDVVHPPGYYILLKIWLTISEQLQWVRLPSLLAASGSVWLLYKLGKWESRSKPDQIDLAWWWPVAYALSGFHLVFDWAGRMYALVSFLTLLQLWSIRKPLPPIWIGLIAFVGLFVDYAFFWSYVMIWILMAVMVWQSGKKREFSNLTALTLGGFPFAIWQISKLSVFQAGINGILWMETSLAPSFWGPFFLGTHTVWPLTLATILLWLKAAWKLPSAWRHSILGWWWLLASFLVLDFTLIYSVLKQPLLHTRSLQFIGLAVGFCWAVVLCQRRWRVIGLVILVVSTLTTTNLFTAQPLQLLLEFYPWQNLRHSIEPAVYDNPHIKLYAKSMSNSPSPLLLEGLLYTFEGKEKIAQTAIPVTAVMDTKETGNCVNFWQAFVVLQGCLEK